MRRNGFTLIEVLVALSLAALVVLLAHQVFSAVADGAARVREARASLDREVNARRWLVEAFGSLAVGQVQGGFDGEPGQAAFTAWLPTATGGFTPVRVTLRSEGRRFVAELAGHGSLTLVDSVATVAFDYLLEPGANERWVGQWISPVSAPVAVRMRLTRDDSARAAPVADTLLLVVGPRG